MFYIKISEKIFKLNTDDKNFIEKYMINNIDKYLIPPEKADYEIFFKEESEYIKEGKHLLTIFHYSLYELEDYYKLSFIKLEDDLSAYNYTYSLYITKDWNSLTIVDYTDKYDRITNKYNNEIDNGIRIFIQSVIIFHESFMIHGVALQYKNKGLIFTASAGVGKTTHTTFWEKKLNAEILNGDTPIIKFIDNKPFIYGSPWCGTSDITINKINTLDAIIFIKRGNQNSIKKISKIEAISRIIKHIRRPTWNIELTELCLQHCEKLIKTVSFYELECLPNEESAEVALAGIEELHD